MSAVPDYVNLEIRSTQVGGPARDKAIRVLARVLKISPDNVAGQLDQGPLMLRRVRVSEELRKLAEILKTAGFGVKAYRHIEPALTQSKVKATERHGPLDKTERKSVFSAVSADLSTKDWKKGDVIEGLYEVLGSSAGGMGRVHFVFHRLWKMMLAIKTPKSDAVKSEGDVIRFLREAELWVQLGVHPNIATCYYARVLDGLPRLFMEFVDGGDLDRWLVRNRKGDLKVLVDFMLQFTHGMMHAERRGMIHRDIKPANCLLTRDGTLKITDFGLVKRVDGPDTSIEDEEEEQVDDTTVPAAWNTDESVTTLNEGIMGSPWYMAPERFTRECPEDIRSDVYSFGVMLYEVLLGEMPFNLTGNFSIRDLVRCHVRKIPVDPLFIRPDIPRALVDILMTCLEKKPGDRYPSFSDVCRALEDAAESLGHGHKPRKRPSVVGLKADSLNNQAVSFLDLGRENDAVQLLENAHSADPDHLQAVYNLFSFRWRKGEVSDQDVVSAMESLKIEVRDTPDYRHFTGLVHVQRGDVRGGLPLLKKAGEERTHYRDNWAAFGGDPEKFIDSLGFTQISEVSHFAGHVKRISTIAFLGDAVMSVGEDRSIRTWLLDGGRCLKNVRTFNFVPVTGAFSPDGSLAATGYGQAFKTLDIWNRPEGRVLRKQQGMSVRKVVFSPDGKRIAAAGYGGSVKVWDAQTGSVLWEAQVGPPEPVSLEFFQNGESLIIGRDDGTMVMYRFNSKAPVMKVQAHEGAVLALAFDAALNAVISGGADGVVRICDARTGREHVRLPGHHGAVLAVRFLKGAEYAVSGATDGQARIWETATGRCCRTIVLEGEKLSALAVSPDSRLIMLGGAKGAMRLWSMDTGWFSSSFLEPAVCRPRTFKDLEDVHLAFKSAVKGFETALHQDSTENALERFNEVRAMPGFSWSREAVLMRNILGNRTSRRGLRSAAFVRCFRGHEAAVTGLDASGDNMLLISGSLDGTAALWDVVTGRCARTFAAASPIRAVLILPMSKGVLTLSEDNVLRRWGMAGNLIGEVPGIRWPIALSEQGAAFSALTSDKRGVRIDAATLETTPLGPPMNADDFLGFTPGCDQVYALLDGARLQRRSLAGGESTGAFRDLGVKITAMHHVATQDRALVGTEIGETAIYMVGSGMNIASLRGHSEPVRAIDVMSDSSVCVTGSDDCMLRLWDFSDQEALAVLSGHVSPVRSVCFFPNGSMIAGGAVDGSVRLWGLDWELVV
ncbi:MAG: protein kinase [Pseudomonadota bacterium]